jgi:hypothetical protein
MVATTGQSLGASGGRRLDSDLILIGAVAKVCAGSCTPAGAAGVVGPKPVPHKMITSPDLADVVITPEKSHS